ncbi:MAG: hypothetical protein HC897_16880, partial [Thermoanaerobaculia bacterium]|nr:hypothetical protein [Thermoanaerobaculia bacterium]
MPKLSASILAAGLTAAALLGGIARAEEPASFKFSLDPTVVVLSVTYTSALNGESREHVLHGDGRFEILKRDRRGGILEQYETFFTYAECEELLRLLVDRGIVETTADDLMEKVRSGLPPGYSTNVTEDAGDTILEIRLESYAKQGQEPKPINKHLRVHAPKVMYHWRQISLSFKAWS